MRITLLGEDALHVRLLAQNLEHRSHAVEVQVLGQDGEWERQLRNILDPSTILLLDLGWFDAAREKQYQRLAQQCNAMPQPKVLLVDESWPRNWVRRFSAEQVMWKPFAMERLGTVVQGLGREKATG